MSKKYGWEEFLVIEGDFIQARKYLSFERVSNLDADSSFMHNEIVLLGSKVETAMKELIKKGSSKKVAIVSIADCKKQLLTIVPDIEKYYVTIVGSDLPPFKPFQKWSSSVLEWWEAYNKIKHGSSLCVPKLEYGLNLLAAFEILLHLIHVIDAKCMGRGLVEYSFSELPKIMNLGFEGTLILDRERPFLYGFDVDNYNLNLVRV